MISLENSLNIAMVLTVIGLVAASLRLVLGPSRADRIVSLDLVTVLLVAIAAQLSVLYNNAAYLDLGLAIALIGFLATVAFARYVENAETDDDHFKSDETDDAKSDLNPTLNMRQDAVSGGKNE